MRAAWVAVAIGTAVAVVSACTGLGNSSSTAAGPPTSGGAAASQPAAATSAATHGVTPPGIVAVTTGGALVRLDPASGAARETMVPAGVLGDEISASANGTLYFSVKKGCDAEVESMPAAGGPLTMIAEGWDPAVSPDGTKLAFASQPSMADGCPPVTTNNPGTQFKLVVRTLASGATVTLPQLPVTQPGLFAPISHLSWAPDNTRLAVSIAAVQDNEGWAVNLVNTTTAKYYLTGDGVLSLPVTGSPTAQQSYLREGVYLPNSELFVSRACCGGVPVRNTSRLMWLVHADGTLARRVAIGYASLDHTSLAVSANGGWLLYLAGNDLYVSQGGARPAKLASGLIAAAWG
jgi:hypothetical protein